MKKNKAIPAGELIRRLNPIIRGWAQYHQHVVSKDTFNAVDCAIYQLVRRWAKRRHPTKSNEWVRKKYFTTVEGNNWVFYAEVDGQKTYLAQTSHVPIKRHVKVKGEANPYDPAWESYYEKRLDVHMEDTLKGKRWLLYLWRSKGGSDAAENRMLLHPNCHQQIHSQGLAVEKPRPAKGVRKA